jgi:UTP:GlnB (protein PII) uridylyltransferase
MHQYLEEAAKSFSIELPDLKKAAEIAKNEIDDFKDLLPKILSDEYHIEDHSELENVDVVVLGSIARQESTTGSDCDYFILQNGASPQATQDLIYATEKYGEQ